ncbi:hypothetical protein ACOMHN_040730 [Nucella lapillus]
MPLCFYEKEEEDKEGEEAEEEEEATEEPANPTCDTITSPHPPTHPPYPYPHPHPHPPTPRCVPNSQRPAQRKQNWSHLGLPSHAPRRKRM